MLPGYVPSVQAMPGRSNGWWISPAIPTIANCALAALWGFSALGGWGDAAFCGEAAEHDPECATGFDDAVVFSLLPAGVALVMAVGAWVLPGIRRDADRLDGLLTAAALVWVVAGGVLFVGGLLAQP